MQKKFDNRYQYFYTNSKGEKRKNAIFSPGIDRFILVDDKDFWVTFETAEILSSKLPTLCYLLPPMNDNIDNSNCINYTIKNKIDQKVGASSIIAARQNPMLKFLYDTDEIVFKGTPVDYEDNYVIIENLLRYAEFLQEQIYVLKIVDAFYNASDTKRFAKSYIDDNWSESFSVRSDRSSLDKGIFFELKKILYLSNTPEEANDKIVDFWLENSVDQIYILNGYYKILNNPIPDKLIEISKSGPTNTSTFLF
jgi:hypothetical protein